MDNYNIWVKGMLSEPKILLMHNFVISLAELDRA